MTVIDGQSLHGGAPTAECDQLVGSVDDYASSFEQCCARASDADLIAELHALERARRRLAALDHALLAELGRRRMALQAGYGKLGAFLQAALRLSPADASRRVQAAELAGPRVALTGEALPPLLPTVAAAAASGELSPEHVTVLARVLDEVPPTTSVADFAAAEATLTEAARALPPKQVVDAGRRLLAHLDPDGRAPSECEQRRHRRVSLSELSDGTVTGSFRLAPAAGAKLIAVLSGQAAPRPADDGTSDPRTCRQRLADALEDLCDLGLRAGQVTPGGPPVQLIITMTAEQYGSRRGLADTSYGQLLPVADALRLAEEADLYTAQLAPGGAVLDFGRRRRCASRTQTLALHVRDGGCSFPGCTVPTDWCQRHHVIPWTDGGKTDLDNLALVCGLHHRNFEHWGWRCEMRGGLPTWIPPATIDGQQRPRRNNRGRVVLWDDT